MGSTWDSAVAVMPYEGLGVVAAIWMASVYVLLKSQGKSRAAFWTRTLQITAQLAGCVIAAFTVGTAVAIAASSAALCWLTVLAGVIVAGRVARKSEENLDNEVVLVVESASRVPADRMDSPSAKKTTSGDARRARPLGSHSDRCPRPWPVIDVLAHEILRSQTSAWLGENPKR
jgi:hypothetical protein